MSAKLQDWQIKILEENKYKPLAAVFMKPIEQATKIFKDSKGIKDVQELIKRTNQIVEIFLLHKNAVDKKIEEEDFEDVNGQDFNEWAHDQLDDIENVYHEMKCLIGQINFEKNGYSIID